MTSLRKPGSLVAVWIKSLPNAARCSFCSGSRSHGTNFATFHAKLLHQNLGHSSFWNPQINFHFSHFRTNLCWLQPVHVQHSQVFCLLLAFQNMDHFQQILDHLWSIRATLLFALHSLHHPKKTFESSKVSAEECLRLTQNLMQIPCSTQSFWMWRPHSTHAHSVAPATPLTVQWSCPCSHMCIPVPSPWLPGYIDVM